MKRALVLSLICVLGLGFSSLAVGTLSGSWDTDITIDLAGGWPGALSLTSDIEVIYTIGDWAFTSTTEIDETGWIGQVFDVTGVLGAFTVDSTLTFVPLPAAFTSWNTVVGVSIAGVTFGFDFTLYPNNVALELTAGGVAGDVDIDATVYFGNPVGLECDLDWTGIVIELGFPFCCADVSAALAFDCTGFDYAEFCVSGLTMGSLPWLTVDACVKFELEQKLVSITPSFDPGIWDCIELNIDLVYDPLADNTPVNITGFVINGFSLECDFGNVIFTAVTDYTNTDYFEWYTISTDDDGCCGPFTFDLGFYFSDSAATLFDVSLVDADMSIQVASQFTFNMGLEVDLEVGATEWTMGFLVTW